MSAAVTWIKSNVPIVALSAAIVVILPAAWFGSSAWNRSIRDAQQTAAEKDLSQLRTANVAYIVEPIVPDVPGVEWSGPPNPTITTFFAGVREDMLKEATAVVELAEKANRSDHGVFVEGLFPNPKGSSLEVKNKSIDMARMIVPSGDPQNPTAYEKLLAEIGAGAPPAPAGVSQIIADLVEGERMRVQAERGSPNLTTDEQKLLAEKLVARRIGEYQRRAQELSVYADISIFPPPKKGQWTGIPTREPEKPADLEKLFEWQFDYWTFREVLKAVAAANTRPDGTRATIPEAAVKRIVSVRVEQLPIWAENNLRARARDDLTPYGPSEVIPPDYSRSFTGRASSAKNHLYDVRDAEVVLVVASARLPELVAALGRSNFITVTGMELRSIDPWSDLKDGYAYGGEHVIEATVRFETVWLRSWTEKLMPGLVKYALGIDTPEEEPGAGGPG